MTLVMVMLEWQTAGLEEDQRGDAEDAVALVTPEGTNRKPKGTTMVHFMSTV